MFHGAGRIPFSFGTLCNALGFEYVLIRFMMQIATVAGRKGSVQDHRVDTKVLFPRHLF